MGESGTPPEEESNALPDDEGTTLLVEGGNLPKEKSDTLLKEEGGTLPKEESSTLPSAQGGRYHPAGNYHSAQGNRNRALYKEKTTYSRSSASLFVKMTWRC